MEPNPISLLGPYPFISIIMPVRNEGEFMKRSLEAVLAQNYPLERIEILVADGQSTDNTREIIRSFQVGHPNLHLIDNPGRIVPTGFNRALAQAHGDVIVRVDGHCEIAPDYVRRGVEHLLCDGVDGVGGPIDTIGATPISRAIAVAMSSAFGVGGSAFRTVKGRAMLVDTVAFPVYSRQAVEQAGLLDEELVRNQDDEYNYRLRELGGKILLTPDIRSRYYSRGSIRSLWRQYYQYGFWKVRCLQKHARQMQVRQFVPAAFVGALLASLPPVVLLPGAWIPLALVLGSYLLANLSASVWTAHRSSWHHLLLLPLIFATLHLSYGLGFLAGLIWFWNRWGDRKTRIRLEA